MLLDSRLYWTQREPCASRLWEATPMLFVPSSDLIRPTSARFLDNAHNDSLQWHQSPVAHNLLTMTRLLNYGRCFPCHLALGNSSDTAKPEGCQHEVGLLLSH